MLSSRIEKVEAHAVAHLQQKKTRVLKFQRDNYLRKHNSAKNFYLITKK